MKMRDQLFFIKKRDIQSDHMELATQMIIAVLAIVALVFVFQFELYRNVLNIVGYYHQSEARLHPLNTSMPSSSVHEWASQHHDLDTSVSSMHHTFSSDTY